jgi:hypothetical protein
VRASAPHQRRRTIISDYWSDRVVFGHVAHLEVASAAFEVSADFTKPLPSAFDLGITMRAAGVDIGNGTFPVQDGPVQIALAIPGCGNVQGRIDDWRGIDSAGNTIDNAADPEWKTASAVAFTLTAVGSVTIPVSAISALVPSLGWALSAALALFGGGRVQVSLGHSPIVLPIHRNAAGTPVANPVVPAKPAA